jgi:CheY-like chemotaxis protein
MAKKILIVDDMGSMRMLLRMILQEEGYQLEEACNGTQALIKCMGTSPPDLVLMDVVMPEMNGLECCRRIKEGQDNIPVLMVTTRGEEQHMHEASSAGCDGYLTKPVNRFELINKVRRLLEAA